MPDPITPPPSARLWHGAVTLAVQLHQGQFRKDGRTPYAAHPFRVALTVRDIFECADQVVLAAALLHDVIEDTAADFDTIVDTLTPYGDAAIAEEVALVVAALTKDMRLAEPRREPMYDEGLRDADWRARLVKLGDVFDNLLDSAYLGGRLERVCEKAERAIVLAEPDAATHPETHRAINRVRELMAQMRGA